MSDIPSSPPPNPSKKRKLGIKPASRVGGQTRIRELKCYQEVYDRIVQGWSIAEVVKFIHEVKKEATDVSVSALTASLTEFRRKLPPGVMTSQRVTPVFMKAKQQVEQGLDELSELAKLYILQMGRIDIDLKLEKKMGKLMPTLTNEVRMAKEILTAIADLKMDLGLSKRHIGEMKVETQVLADIAVRYQQPEVREVMANPQARKKLLNLAERLLSARSGPATVRNSVPEIIEMEAQPLSEEDIPELEELVSPAEDDR